MFTLRKNSKRWTISAVMTHYELGFLYNVSFNNLDWLNGPNTFFKELTVDSNHSFTIGATAFIQLMNDIENGVVKAGMIGCADFNDTEFHKIFGIDALTSLDYDPIDITRFIGLKLSAMRMTKAMNKSNEEYVEEVQG